MFYEGTEKRLEIIIKESDLLQFPELFWVEMLQQADTFILSKIENRHVTAYLLSESSLFIWQNRILLITCGNTHLVKAAQYLQKKIPKENIQSLLFHRHQSIQPHLQKSSFAQDTIILSPHFPGNTQHWRGKYQGDIFHFENNNNLLKQDNKQILMCHGLHGHFAKKLQAGTAIKKEIEGTLALQTFLPQLSIDQFIFEPKGYSLNAICGRDYLTIHLTPEKRSAYLSVETSYMNKNADDFINHLLILFNPTQSNLMRFTSYPKNSLKITLSEPKIDNALLRDE